MPSALTPISMTVAPTMNLPAGVTAAAMMPMTASQLEAAAAAAATQRMSFSSFCLGVRQYRLVRYVLYYYEMLIIVLVTLGGVLS